jgi:hypothetical protein
MNDNQLSTMVRESVADVHSTTPVMQIISRGRAVRARRGIPGAAATLFVAAGTALAVTTLLPSSHPGPLPSAHPASHPASVRLAAWTVAKQANGDIDITINQLRNPSGLQSTLRADGLPASVTFSGPSPSASCQPYAASTDVLSAVAQYNTGNDSAYLVINPSALPSGTGVAIFDEPGKSLPVPSASPGALRHGKGSGKTVLAPAPAGWTTGPLAVGLVYASQQCTG